MFMATRPGLFFSLLLFIDLLLWQGTVGVFRLLRTLRLVPVVAATARSGVDRHPFQPCPACHLEGPRGEQPAARRDAPRRHREPAFQRSGKVAGRLIITPAFGLPALVRFPAGRDLS